MTQYQLDKAVARATGDNLGVISRLGFSLADPIFVEHDPEPCDLDDVILDWDAETMARNVAFFPRTRSEPAIA